MRRRRERAGLAIVALVGVLVLAGCSLVSGILHTESALRDAGFGNPSVHVHAAGGQPATVDVTTDGNASAVGSGKPSSQQVDQVAEIVWDNLNGRFDLLNVSVTGVGSHTYTHAGLARRFGPRPGDLDATTISGEVASTAEVFLIGVAIALLVITLVVVLILLGVRRKRKRQRQEHQLMMMTTLPPEMWGYANPAFAAYPPPVPGQAYPPPAPPPPAPASSYPPPVPDQPVPPAQAGQLAQQPAQPNGHTPTPPTNGHGPAHPPVEPPGPQSPGA